MALRASLPRMQHHEPQQLQHERDELLQKQASLRRQLCEVLGEPPAFPRLPQHRTPSSTPTPTGGLQKEVLRHERAGLQHELHGLEEELGRLLALEQQGAQRFTVPLSRSAPLGLEYEECARGGVLVTGVSQWGTARSCGLRPGASVIAVEGRPVRGGADLRRALQAALEQGLRSVEVDAIPRKAAQVSPERPAGYPSPLHTAPLAPLAAPAALEVQARRPLPDMAPPLGSSIKPAQQQQGRPGMQGSALAALCWPDEREVHEALARQVSVSPVVSARSPLPAEYGCGPASGGRGVACLPVEGGGVVRQSAAAASAVVPVVRVLSPSRSPPGGLRQQQQPGGLQELVTLLSGMEATQRLLLQKACSIESELGEVKRIATQARYRQAGPVATPPRDAAEGEAVPVGDGGRRKLRFAAGDRVTCNLGGRWVPGEVVATNWRGRTWPAERAPVPYQIRITATQQLVFAPIDDDRVVHEPVEHPRQPQPPPVSSGPVPPRSSSGSTVSQAAPADDEGFKRRSNGSFVAPTTPPDDGTVHVEIDTANMNTWA